jgi:hypothetical protein
MIDTSQCVALIVKNNKLKFHQDQTIDNPPISDRNGYVKNTIFLSSLTVCSSPFSKLTSSLSVSQAEKSACIFFLYFFNFFFLP